MSKFPIKRIRTLALVGQAGSGKTSLAEALLARAGAIPAAGSIERGSTVCDYTPLEKTFQHSLKLAVASFEAQQHRIHLLDTPGYPDFIGHALPALAAVETAAIVINAQNGIEMMTGRFMQWAAKRGLDRLVIVNRIDAENVDLPGLLDDIQQAFGKECLPLNLPAAGASKVSDCFFAPSGEADFSSVEAAHRKLVEQVVEVDEKLMEHYLEKGEVSPEELHEPLERAMREGHLIPVVFTSARTGAGIGELLDVIVKLLPNPAEGNPPVYLNVPTGGEAASDLTALPDPGLHALAHVFKIEIDPYVGRLAVFRVHQGRIAPGTQLYIGEGRKPVKPGHLYVLRGKTQVEVAEAVPGDICAIAKIDDIQFDHILHDSPSDAHIHARPLELPVAVFGLAVQPKKRGDEQKVSDVLHKLMAEDPCFRLEHNAQANETVMRGIGEMHLKVMLEKMASQYKVELDTRPPSIPYRETIAARAEGHSRHKKQTGGAGQFGEVFLKVEPLPRGQGFEFVDKVKGGAIPNQFIPAVEKGVRGVLQSGFIAGYPMQDLRVIVYDGKHHPVDSKEVAFVSAGRKAFLDALGKARPIVLEPIVNVDVVAPEQKMGDIAGELSGHRGQIKGSDAPRPGTVKILAQAPLSELEQFPARLKSLTAGHGSYTFEFSHYEQAPPLLQQKLVAAHRPAVNADD
ncbi:MAG: elongation factor G [candidate division NC10 bacterium RIFCSPLOWO2_02_FULL_66_22]|nr:MAG: elongation factor G [candidate division NC10 bacterium RIFCSPLOWO2_02_FULL_66_22]